MKLEDQVVGVEIGRELRKLDVNQDTLFSHFQYDEWNVVIRETREIFSAHNKFQFNENRLICAAHTVAEIGLELPSSVEFGNKKYYLYATRTEKGKWFNLSDHYVAYQDIFGNCYLHSERDDNEANARAKMKIWLLKRSDVINEI